MVQILQMVKLVLGIVPEIVTIILMLEKTLPQAGIGTEKMAALRAILTGAYEGIGAVWGSIEVIVNTFVSMFNKHGWPEEKETPTVASPK
jgi:hypothetical protein